MEPTQEGWRNLCWLAALMASQGELQRRSWGYDPRPMVTMEQLRTGFMAADSIRLREAVRDALAQGFQRDVPSQDADEEVNLVLLEREEAEKKAKAAVASGLSSLLQRLSAFISPQKKP